jgi:hypothetical protein
MSVGISSLSICEQLNCDTFTNRSRRNILAASLATADAILLADTFPAIATIEHNIMTLPQRHMEGTSPSGTTLSIKYANIHGKKRSITVPTALTHNPLAIFEKKGRMYLRIIVKSSQPSEVQQIPQF